MASADSTSASCRVASGGGNGILVPVGEASWRGAMKVTPEADDDELVFYTKTFF